MRALLQRTLFVGGNRYRVSSNGTEIPDDAELPQGTKIWDGKEFVDAPDNQREREALIKKSSKAVTAEEEADPDDRDLPTRVYDPRYKSPEAKEPIVGQMPLAPEVKREQDLGWQGKGVTETLPPKDVPAEKHTKK